MTPRTVTDWHQLARDDPGQLPGIWQRLLQTSEGPGQKAAVAWKRPDLGETLAWRRAAERNRSLAGVPVAVSDLLALPGSALQASHPHLPEVWQPSVTEAALCRELAAHGALVAFKTHGDELGAGLAGGSARFGHVPHPHAAGRHAGGGAAGAAWTVARRLVPVAFSLDGLGGVRTSAAWSGVLAWRQPLTIARQEGVLSWTPHLEAMGVLASSLDTMRSLLALYNPAPPTEGTETLRLLGGSQWLLGRTHPVARACVAAEEALGADPLEESAGGRAARLFAEAAEALRVMVDHTLATRLNGDLAGLASGLSAPLRQRVEAGRAGDAEALAAAGRVRQKVRRWFQKVFTQADAVVLPTVPTPAPWPGVGDPFGDDRVLSLLAPVSLASLPAFVWPIMVGEQLTGGLQVVYPADRPEVAARLLARGQQRLGLA